MTSPNTRNYTSNVCIIIVELLLPGHLESCSSYPSSICSYAYTEPKHDTEVIVMVSLLIESAASTAAAVAASSAPTPTPHATWAVKWTGTALAAERIVAVSSTPRCATIREV